VSRYTKIWLRAALIRAIRSVSQTALATLGTGAMLSEVNWMAVGSASLMAGIFSVLTSLAGLPECKNCGEEAEKRLPS